MPEPFDPIDIVVKVVYSEPATVKVFSDLQPTTVKVVPSPGGIGATGPTGPTGSSGVISVTSPITNTGTSTAAIIGIDQTLLTLSQSQITNLTTDLSGKASLSANNTFAGTQTFNGFTQTFNNSVINGKVTIGPSSLVANQQLNITSQATTNIGLVVKGITSQSANLTEWQDSTGTRQGYVAPGGNTITFPGIYSSYNMIAYSGGAAIVPFMARGVATQTANLTEWQDSSGTVKSFIASTGYFAIGATSPGGQIGVQIETAANRGIVVKGATSQTANLQEWQNSAGTILVRVASDGAFYAGGLNAFANGNTSFNNVVTTPYLTVQQYATIGGNNPVGSIPLTVKAVASQTANLQEWQNSSGTMLSRITATGSFQSDQVAYFGSGATSILDSRFNVASGNAAVTGVTIRGAASQTANLTEWEDSAGTVMARINNGGAFVSSSVGVFGAQSNTPNAQLYVLSGNAANPGFVVKGAVAQAGDYTTWQNSGGTTVAALTSGSSFYATGQIRAGASTSFAQLSSIAASASTIALGVRAAASQTADIAQFQNSSGTSLIRIASNGLPYLSSSNTSTIDLQTEAANDMALTLPADDWDDKLRWRYGLYETSTDGVTAWTAGSFDSQITDGRMDSYITLPTASLGHRFTFYDNANFPYMSARYLRISSGYVNPASTISVNYETSLDNITWVSRGSWTGISGYIMKRLFRVSDSADHGYIRITITYTTVQAALSLENIELLTYRPGNQGGLVSGVESRLPFQSWGSTRIPVISPTSTQSTALIVRASPTLTRTITNAVGSGTTITFTTSTPHLYRPGQNIVVTGVNPTAYNITGTVLATTSLTTFTVTNAATGTYVSGGSVVSAHTGDLQQWQDQSGTVLARIYSNGILATTGILANSGQANSIGGPTIAGVILAVGTAAAGNKGLVVKGVSGQTANLQEWQNSGGTAVGSVTNGGVATFISEVLANDTAASTIGLQVKRTLYQFGTVATEIGAIIKGAASQTANLQEWQNSAGSVLGYVTATGGFSVTGRVSFGTDASARFNVSPQSATQIGQVVRGFASQTADLQQWQNSAGTVLASISAYGGLGINTAATLTSFLTVQTTATARGAVIKGASGQTANLTEWQNNSGTVLARVGADGEVRGAALSTIFANAYLNETNSGGYLRLQKQTAENFSPGADKSVIYFRNGTASGTLKLVVKAGASGQEQTVVDNIDQSTGNTPPAPPSVGANLFLYQNYI